MTKSTLETKIWEINWLLLKFPANLDCHFGPLWLYRVSHFCQTLQCYTSLQFIQVWLNSHGQIKRHPYIISTIEMRVFWLGMKCLKSATRLLNRVFVGRRGLDLSKEVLWVSICQRAAELLAGKVGGLKKILPCSPPRTTRVRPGFDSRTTRSSSNFDSLYFYSPLKYRDSQYLFWKI